MPTILFNNLRYLFCILWISAINQDHRSVTSIDKRIKHCLTAGGTCILRHLPAFVILLPFLRTKQTSKHQYAHKKGDDNSFSFPLCHISSHSSKVKLKNLTEALHLLESTETRQYPTAISGSQTSDSTQKHKTSHIAMRMSVPLAKATSYWTMVSLFTIPPNTVKKMILRSSPNVQFSIYQISYSTRLVMDVSPRSPFTCAQPVMPGRTC